MTPSEIVNAFIGAIEAKDIDRAVSFTAPGISYENVPIDPIVGQPGLRATLGMFLAPATTVDWQIVAQWEFGNTVVNERLDRFEIGAGWLELPVAGVFHLEDDKITVWRDYFDMATYQEQFAALSTEP